MTLVLLNDAAGAPRIVRRVPEGAARREDALRDLLLAHPAMLPVGEIDPGIGPLVPVARELNVPDVGRIDAFLVDARGHLVIVECKLWRNPQARREVVGQILDYARALARFSYEDLQREVSRATGSSGNALYQLVAAGAGTDGMDEAQFVDRVSRNLAAGRFLLLVVGDGITEGTQRIGEYLVAQPGLAFDFALVEMAQYAWTDGTGAEQVVVQPRLLAKTVVIERAVIRNEASVVIADLRDEPVAPAGEGRGRKLDSGLQEAWRGFAEHFLAGMVFDDPSQPPPRIGGLGWMKAPLPRGHWLTLYRASGSGRIGAYINLPGSEGLAAFERLAADRALIDEELAEAGLPAPAWERTDKGATITLAWPSPLPWDEGAEMRQRDLLRRAANQLVNSFRPRLEQIGPEG
ncbi:hypothetical protein H7F51_18295 [Novosphingobium flavum]|uniref:DUF4268 domain-containing protein n=1 Tax=Novosphingobium flavum TaxID=1778672 RepID=A0A7X1FV06_9SPHN|nr:hypothetical protein [Novosphingobium flavum]MBC2667473.1 hypothetical protein [Novosphingobium flavum]